VSLGVWHKEAKMKKLHIIAAIACIFMVTACDQDRKSPNFQLLTANKKVYRLNTQSGEIIVFSRSGIKKYDDNYIAQAFQRESGLSKLRTDKKTFPESNGHMWARLSYKWRNDNILYRYSFGPYSDELQKALNDFSSSITIEFLDKDGFPVVTQNISLSSLTRIIDENGKPTFWQKEGKISCSKDDYLLITSTSTPWSFTKSLRETVKKCTKALKKVHEENWKKLRALIKSGKLMGKVENDNLYLLEKDGSYKKIDPKDYAYVEFLIKNPELVNLLQGIGNIKPSKNIDQSGDDGNRAAE